MHAPGVYQRTTPGEIFVGELDDTITPRVEALAMALVDVLCDARLRREFGAAGAAHVAKLFPLERMIAKHESLYQRILAKRRTG